MTEQQFIDRPPRLQPEIPAGEHEIPGPPSKEARQQPLWQLFLPAITIVGYLLISIFGRGRSIWLMIPMGISVVVSIIAGIYLAREDRRKQEEAEAAYDEYLIEMRRKMMQEHDMQRRFYRYNYPDPAGTMQIAADTSPQTTTGSTYGYVGSRLWERRTSDADFCAVRLGIGTLPSTVQYVLDDGGSIEDPQLRDAIRLAEDSKYVSDVPIMIPLRYPPGKRSAEEKVEPARHAIGITGKYPSGVYAFIRSLIVNYATFHAPSDARLYVLGSEQAQVKWKWVSPLPHCQNDKPQEIICFEDANDRQGEKETSKVSRFLKSFRQLLDERLSRLMDPEYKMNVTLPHLLLVIDTLAAPVEDSRLKDLETDPAISLIMKEGPALGAAVIFLVSAPRKVPGDCQAVIEINVANPDIELDLKQTPHVDFRYTEVGVNTLRYSGQADIVQSDNPLQKFAEALSPLAVRMSYGADLPPTVHLLDMLKVSTMEQLQQLIKENWLNSQTQDQADWLKGTLGMLLGGDYRTLRFSADADGVHGLIAGSTGSGKSELLMTMILGLAVNYDPSIVNFVLVDFKGGGAFKPLENLPHVVDVVTNLGESGVERMFAAIRAELNRRQAINTRTNSKHIVHYRRRGLHLPDENGRYGQPVEIQDQQFQTEPYPHLFIFIDEFAEMIADNPEYKAQLNSITRLGRALGVTLILAAQRPTGVTDQMRANIKFRIALRVETREESSEILRRSDAAYLPTGIPGRGYLQIGNENIEMIQVAWSGADYTGEQVQEEPDVIWLNREARTGSWKDDDEVPKVFEEIVKLMTHTSEEISIPQQMPWPDFLPEKMSLQTAFDASYLEDELNLIELSGEGQQQTAVLNPNIAAWLSDKPTTWPGIDWREQAMRAVVGLVDNPYQSEQMPLVVDFRRGHAVIFGASGWGKTIFLRTVMTTLAVTHSPRELHAYILDFGGRQMNIFRKLPHVGAVITADEEERVRRLLRKLESILEQRKKQITELGMDNLYSYNVNDPQQVLPAILILIDNFAEFKESFEYLLPQLTSLVRESRAWGMHFVISAEMPNALAGKLYSLLTERLTLRLSDPTEYPGIVGRGARVLEEMPGRGFVRVDRRALEFQTALPVGSTADLEKEVETQRLLELVNILHEHAQELPESVLAAKIMTLATTVSLRDIVPQRWPDPRRPRLGIRPAVAIDDLNLAPWSLDLLADGPHCTLIGTPNTGTTTLLRSLILSLAHTYTPDEVTLVLVDFQQRLFRYGGQRTLSDLPHVVETIANSDHIETFIENLRVECQSLAENKHSIWVIIDNYESFSDDVSDKLMPLLAVMARESGTLGLHFVIGGSPDVLRTPDTLRKQVQMPRFGIALDVESANRLNGRVPRTLLQDELPVGRGFAVKSGRTSMAQFATPYADAGEMEATLDAWIMEIQVQYPNQQAAWRRQPLVQTEGDQEIAGADRPLAQQGQSANMTPASPPEQSVGASTAETVAVESREEDERRYALSSAIPEGIDVALLRQQIEEMFGSSVDLLSKIEVYNTALSMGLIEDSST